MPSRRHDTHASTERTPLLKPDVENGTSATSVLSEHDRGDEVTLVTEELSFVRLAVVMSTAWFGLFLSGLDTTVLATLSAPISSEFKSLSLLSWLATAYLISNAACQTVAGRLTDIFGRGPGIVFSHLVFAVGNLVCGLATNQQTMILGRVVAGIGGGGLSSIATFLASDLIPLRKRGLAGGLANIWFGIGIMVGAAFGGILNDYTAFGWRLAFLIQVPAALLCAVVVFFLVKVPPKKSDKSYLKRIDFGGVLLTTLFLTLLVLGLNSGGNLVPWTHPLPPTALTLSACLFVAFIWWERRALQPVIPVKLLLDRTVVSCCLTSLFCTMISITTVFYVPLYLQVRGETASSAGLKILPSSIGLCLGALGTGYLMQKSGKYIGAAIGSISAMVVGLVMFCMQDRDSPTWLTSTAYFLVAGGHSAVFTIARIACVAAVDHSQQAVVTSTTFLARSIGGTAGVAIASAVYQGVLRTRLTEEFGDGPNASEVIHRILNDLGELQHLPDGWYEGVMSSFIEAFHSVWLLMLGWGILSMIAILPMKQHTLYSNLERK